MRWAGHVAGTGEIEAIYGVMVLQLERHCMEYVGVYGLIHEIVCLTVS